MKGVDKAFADARVVEVEHDGFFIRIVVVEIGGGLFRQKKDDVDFLGPFIVLLPEDLKAFKLQVRLSLSALCMGTSGGLSQSSSCAKAGKGKQARPRRQSEPGPTSSPFPA